MQGLAAATKVAVRVLTVVMLGALAVQVIMRTAFNAPPSWTEEIALLAFSWTVLLGMAYGVREGVHVRMDLLLDVLPRALRRLTERLVLSAIVAVGVYLVVAGWQYTESAFGITSAATGYPMPLLYASCVVSGALVAAFALERLLAGAAASDDPDPAEALQ